ncbi:MAG: winged helix-turn-helix domain-containing protein [Chloroflexi bacterium]|nr:winged helix-turn-helix domain-containing protein [Chloroflexota bacterium]
MSRDGQAIPPGQFVRRRSLTLLKILLTRYGKPVHREELMDLLWPETDPHTAATALKVAVHYLRRALEPSAPADQPSSFVRREGDFLVFDPGSPHRLDSRLFLDAADRGTRLAAHGGRQQAIDAYEEAVALYAGDFLEDERYSDWCAAERERFRDRFLDVLRQAAGLHREGGNFDAAVACYRRALQVEGTIEDVHRALMETLWRAGRRDEALRQYLECRTVLAQELGVAPMPETEALRRRIANGNGAGQ